VPSLVTYPLAGALFCSLSMNAKHRHLYFSLGPFLLLIFLTCLGAQLRPLSFSSVPFMFLSLARLFGVSSLDSYTSPGSHFCSFLFLDCSDAKLRILYFSWIPFMFLSFLDCLGAKLKLLYFTRGTSLFLSLSRLFRCQA
jgi:hypothetical protein